MFRPKYDSDISWVQIRRFNLLLLLLVLLLPPLLLSWFPYLRTSILVKRWAVLSPTSLSTLVLSNPTEYLRWSRNPISDVKCEFKSGSLSRYPSLLFFITIISAPCRLFLSLIKYKLINGLLLLTRHRFKRDTRWWTVRVARSIRQPTACPPLTRGSVSAFRNSNSERERKRGQNSMAYYSLGWDVRMF